MNFKFKTLIASLALCIGFSTSTQAAEGENPAELVKNVTQQVLNKLAEDKDRVGKDASIVNEYVSQFVLPNFDFDHMSQLVLGKYWDKASAQEQADFTEQFRTLLVRTYASSLTGYSDQVIEYLPWRAGADPDNTTVGIEIIPQAGPSIPMDYALHRVDGNWKVYDVVVDGLSLVTNYRRSFGKKARAEGVGALVAELKAKNG